MDAVMSQADELTAALVPAIVGDAGVPA
jgi:hypothetical protein